MLKIENDNGRGYTIATPSERCLGFYGWKVHANDLSEVHKGVDHFFGGGGQHATNDGMPGCPLCRKAVRKSRRKP